MPIHKVPLAVWNDAQGNTIVSTMIDDSVSAVDRDERLAVAQVKKCLEWAWRQSHPGPRQDLNNLTAGRTSATLRPQYLVRKVRHTAETGITLDFDYVFGRWRDGQVLCFFPALGLRFQCSHPDSIPTLAQYEIQQHFSGANPAEILEGVLPASPRAASVNIRVDDKFDSGFVNEFPELSGVAMALGQRGVSRQFQGAWLRDREIVQVSQRLSQSRGNLLLVGPRGVGKTTILAEAVRRIVRDSRSKPSDNQNSDSPRPDQRFWLTSASRMIAGMRYLGEWQERCETIIDELAEVQGVLCFENLLELVRTGGDDPAVGLAAFLRHFLVDERLRIVSECTPAELQAIRRLLPGFDTLFHVMRVEPMNEADALATLALAAEQRIPGKQLEVWPAATSLAWRLFRRFMPYDTFPGKCIAFWRRLLDRCAVKKKSALTTDDVIAAFTDETGLPEWLLRDERTLDWNAMEKQFSEKIVGQPVACSAMADLVMNLKASMNDPARPIGVLLYCGPTGVGKTQMAKTLGDVLFGSGQSGDRLVRLDMSEYSTPGSAERLLLQPDGQPSQLVQRVRQTPFVVLLLDEIEKAAHEVFDALMTVFDEGRMEDRLGRETCFQSAVIVMTSNLGTELREPIGFSGERNGAHEGAVRKYFRPEFFNRLDRVVSFGQLDIESIRSIARMEIAALEKREGLSSRNIRIEITDQALEEICHRGYDPRLGARPLQRTVETLVMTPLAHWIAEHPSTSNTTLRVQKAATGIIVIS